MKKNEASASQSANLFPLTLLGLFTLVGVAIALVMLYGLHNKIPKPPVVEIEQIVTADEIGEIKLDHNMVRINLMERGANGKVDKLQEVAIPLEKFAAGYPRIKSFMDQMIEKGIITEQ